MKYLYILLCLTIQLFSNAQTIWNGSVNTDWNLPANWSAGIPNSTVDVIIPASLPNYPVLNSTGNGTRNISLGTGSSIVLNDSATLSVNGTFNSTNATIRNLGKIILNGNAVQNFPGSSSLIAAMKDLLINNPAGVIIDKSFGLSGTLSVSAGDVTLNNIYITLRSDSVSTARIGMVNGRFLYTGTGRFVNERYYSARRSWHLTTTPLSVSATNTFFNSWQIGGKTAATNPGEGTYITGSNPNVTNGLDPSVQNSASLKWFNTASQAFVNVTNTKTTTVSGNAAVAGTPDNIGYIFFNRGDRNSSNLNSGTTSFTTIRDTGKLQTGIQNFPVAASVGQYTLIGNPYASAVDFDLLTLNNVARKFWAWDPNLNTSGGYVLVDGYTGSYITAPAMGYGSSVAQTQQIQATQAFFVQTTGAGAGVTFNESCKSADYNHAVFRPADNPVVTESLITNLYLIDNNGSTKMADGTVVQFNDLFSADVDFADAIKFGNSNEQLSFSRNNNSLALERRPLINYRDTLFLKLTKTVERKYRFQFISTNLNHPGMEGFLQDAYTGLSTPINLNGITFFDFFINTDSVSFLSTRFRIVFKPAELLPVNFIWCKATAIQNNHVSAGKILVSWKTSDDRDVNSYDIERSVNGIDFYRLYSVNSKNNSNAVNQYNWEDCCPAKGMNFYRISSKNHQGEILYSEIAKVNSLQTAYRISLKNNPVTDGLIRIQLNEMPAGNFRFEVLNSNGQLVKTGSIVHLINSSEAIIPITSLPKGMYSLKIYSPENHIHSILVVSE